MTNAQKHQTGRQTICRQIHQGMMALGLLLLALTPTLAQAAAPSSSVPFAQALADARKVAATHEGWKVFVAKGESMEPQFGGTSLLLADETHFQALKPGMLVVYRDKAGDLVAHRLIESTAAGWVAKGLNNDRVDPGLVTVENFQGVVFGTFNYKTGTDSLLVLNAGEKLPVAYAKRY